MWVNIFKTKLKNKENVKNNWFRKKFKLPIEDFEIIKKLLFIHKNQSYLKENEFYSLKGINIEINVGEKMLLSAPQAQERLLYFQY